MKARIYTSLVATCFITCIGCKTSLNFKNVRIHKDNYVYSYADSTGAKLTSYRISKKSLTTLKEDGDAVYIKIDAQDAANIVQPQTVKVPPSSVGQPIPELRAFSFPSARKYYYSAKEAAFPNEDRTGLRYTQLRPFLQASTIPLKFRGPVGNALPQVEASLNGAIAGGVKWSYNKYTGTKNGLGFSTNSKSIALGGLVGFGTADLKSSTTQGLVPDTKASKNAFVSAGLELIFGLNNFNLGIAVGEDIITGPNRTSWNYFGKPWVGILVGIDIIK